MSTITIKISSLELVNNRAFLTRVIEVSRNTRTYREAYETVEKEYTDIFQKNRYASYESFRVAKSRLQNPKQSNQLELF